MMIQVKTVKMKDKKTQISDINPELKRYVFKKIYRFLII